MCHPAYYPPYAKACGHAEGVWCACTKYRRHDDPEHLGSEPQDTEARVLRSSDSSRGNPRDDGEGSSTRLDEHPISSSDIELGRYGEFDSDSILVFDQ